MKKFAITTVLWLVFAPLAFAQEAFIHVIDVGQGLCCVAKVDGNHYMVYDGGLKGNAIPNLQDMIPLGSTIDLLVLSHCDYDHCGCTPFICQNYVVKRVLRDGRKGTSQDWKNSVKALQEEVANEGCEDLNLGDDSVTIRPGKKFRLGGASVTFVCGFCELPSDWTGLDKAETRNAGSVVVRLDYEGKSVLFTGDAVGKHRRGEDEPIATEKYMLDHADKVPIDTDVLIAPHHGGDNSSTTQWIKAVSPKYVIFSAGTGHEHPWDATVQRYLAAHIPSSHIFRTDLGDDEGGEEWVDEKTGVGDESGDDDVGIWIRPNQPVVVQYLAAVQSPTPLAWNGGEKKFQHVAKQEPTCQQAQAVYCPRPSKRCGLFWRFRRPLSGCR